MEPVVRETAGQPVEAGPEEDAQGNEIYSGVGGDIQKGKDGGRMKTIFARWPQLGRRQWQQLAKVALGMMLFWVLLALALLLSGCLPQGEKPATWVPSIHVTTMQCQNERCDMSYISVYVYECDATSARIEPNAVLRAGRWIERTRLRPDVCKAEQP